MGQIFNDGIPRMVDVEESRGSAIQVRCDSVDIDTSNANNDEITTPYKIYLQKYFSAYVQTHCYIE